MSKWYKYLIFSLLAFLLWPAYAKAPDKNDVRVLIDISGSMKHNDPQNLRRPALRMLVGLLQPGTRAGVWTFAKWSNPLVPMAEVDGAWKKKALALSKQIKSPGAFTNIERVLTEATKTWSGEPVAYNRHLVLLTDGMVDVSKDSDESAASRQRILDQLLPRLKVLGVKVHTIALSGRADHELMKRLSGDTGGWYQQVEGADQLKRVFLKVFEQVGKPEGVPLKDNRFTVDASVREATVLLFREKDSSVPVLVSPTGEEFKDSDLVAGVAWYKDQGYDLITISSPAKGDWSLQADVDPDNRVMIVTDLKLETSEVPAHLAVGEAAMLEAHLSNKGKVVDRKAFLRLLDVRADAATNDGTDPLGLNDKGENGDQKAGDGRYSVEYREQSASDEVELLFRVDSPTFMREKRYLLAVHEPAELAIEGKGDAARAVVKISSAVMADGARIDVWQGASEPRKPLQEKDGGYPLADTNLPVFVKVEGKSLLGNLVSREIGPVYVPGVEPPETNTEAAKPAEPVQEKPVAQQDNLPEPAVQEEQAVTQETDEKDGWVMPAVIFGVANLLLVGIGLGVWWYLRRRGKSEDELSLEDEIESDDPGANDSVDEAVAEGSEGGDSQGTERSEAA